MVLALMSVRTSRAGIARLSAKQYSFRQWPTGIDYLAQVRFASRREERGDVAPACNNNGSAVSPRRQQKSAPRPVLISANRMAEISYYRWRLAFGDISLVYVSVPRRRRDHRALRPAAAALVRRAPTCQMLT